MSWSSRPLSSARWSKAARGELYTIPPAGYDIDELGQWVKSSDAAVVHAMVTVFEKFDELGSARQVFAWWQGQGLKYPVRRLRTRVHPVVWLTPTYAMFLRTLHNPIYTGAYVFGRSKTVRCLDDQGVERGRLQRVERDDWPVVIYDHHDAYISYDHVVKNQERLRGNATMRSIDQPGPAREGMALLPGLVLCGHCGRRMGLSYGGATRARVYQYRCSRARAQQGGPDCQVIGGKRVDQAVVEVFLEATTPCTADAARLANEEAYRESQALRLYWAHQIERRWEQALKELERVRVEAEQAVEGPQLLSANDLENVHLLGQELRAVWDAGTTTNRDRKRLLRCLIEEVQLSTGEDHYTVRIVWRGGAMTERELVRGPAGWAPRTPEDTVELVRQLATEFDDAQIARILNKQGRRSGRGIAFTGERSMKPSTASCGSAARIATASAWWLSAGRSCASLHPRH